MNKQYPWLILITTISFMLCIFAPIDAFFSNRDDYWFEVDSLLLHAIVVFIVVFVILTVIAALSARIKKQTIVYAIMLGFLLYFYIQGNYVPRNYGILTGEEIEWDRYAVYGVISCFLILIISIVIITIMMKFKVIIYRIGSVVSAFILLILVITTAYLFVNHGNSNSVRSNSMVVTDKGLFSLGKKNNIVVFIMDSFDSSTMKALLNGSSADWVKSALEDFTYYPNTSGAYPSTIGGVPHILTGAWNENSMIFPDYIREGYKESPLYKELLLNDYSIGVYAPPVFVNNESFEILNVKEGKYFIKDHIGFVKELYKLCAFNYSPHQLKHLFYTTADEFDAYAGIDGDSKYADECVPFYEKLLSDCIDNSNSDNSYRIYYLTGTHPPYTFGRSLSESDKNKTYGLYDEAEGCITLIKEYIEQLKNADIYDKTSIIIMADHGQFDMHQNPVFMIKLPGEAHGFEESGKKMSYEWFNEIVIEIIKQRTINDTFLSNLCEKERRFLYYSIDEATGSYKYLPDITEYEVGENARDYQQMNATGNYYSYKKSDYDYEMGTLLDFKMEPTQKHLTYGFLSGAISSEECALRFDIPEVESRNIEVSLTLGDVFTHRVVRLYVGDEIIAEFLPQKGREYHFIVPKELVSSSFEIKMKQPTGYSYGIQIDSCQLNYSEKPYVSDNQRNVRSYKLGEEILFSDANEGAMNYIVEGFSTLSGASGTWTVGSSSFMSFLMNEQPKEIELSFSYESWREQDVSLFINDELISQFTTSAGVSDVTHKMEYDNRYNGWINVCFKFEDILSPYEAGYGMDTRSIGLLLNRMTISNSKSF